MKKIVFQGDSITDMGRDRERDFMRGIGYPTLVAAELGFERAGEFEFINRGIGGNRIVDIYARMKRDIILLKPDILSILVGVNDVWHDFAEIPNGVSTEKYEKVYNMLIKEIKEELPETKLMILEPFVLKADATTETWNDFRSGVEEKAAAAKRVAEENGIKFVPLMKLFDEAAKKVPASYWLIDGVHPTAMGHELIKREWIKAFLSL